MHKISQFIYDICKTYVEFYDIKILSWGSLDSSYEPYTYAPYSYRVVFCSFVMGRSYDFEVVVHSQESILITPYIYRAIYEISEKYGIKSNITKDEMVQSLDLSDPFQEFLKLT